MAWDAGSEKQDPAAGEPPGGTESDFPGEIHLGTSS